MKNAARVCFHYLQHHLPNTRLNNFVVLLLLFIRSNQRLPRLMRRARAEINDYIFWRCLKGRWTPTEILCVDKEYAKLFASYWGNVSAATTVDVIELNGPAGRELAVEQLQKYVGLRCVAKPTHGCGGVLFLDEDCRREDLSAFVELCSHSVLLRGRETQYAALEKKIIIEENICRSGHVDDYKFFCCRGKAAYCQVDIDRFADHKRAIVDVTTFEALDVVSGYHRVPDYVAKPATFDRMLQLAEQLSAGFEFVRVDLYEVDGVVYFGEFTFTPGGAIDHISNREWARRVIQPMKTRKRAQPSGGRRTPLPRRFGPPVATSAASPPGQASVYAGRRSRIADDLSS